MNATQVLGALIGNGIRVGAGQRSGALTLFPLSTEPVVAGYLLYESAQEAGLVSIEETSEAGSVGELKVSNRAELPLLLVEGEILLGMKQTRVLNATILVPALAVLTVPVSCVEVGRWSQVSAAAVGKDVFNLSPSVRQTKSATVTSSLQASGDYRSDQSAVWAGVEDRISRHAVEAPTTSYEAVNVGRRQEIADYVHGLCPSLGQTGVIAYIGRRPACLDLFDSPATLKSLWDGLVGSYAADAMTTSDEDSVAHSVPVSRLSAKRWLAGLARADSVVSPGVGLGELVTTTSGSIAGAALVYGDQLLHLAAFPVVQAPRRSAFNPPSRRRSG